MKARMIYQLYPHEVHTMFLTSGSTSVIKAKLI